MNTTELCRAFEALDTPCVSDALDRLGIPCGLYHIRPQVPGTGRTVCGPAYTVRYIPVGLEKRSVGDFLDDVPVGSVVVLDNNGRDDCTVWGAILSRYSVKRGIAATVIYGVCRDIRAVREVGYSIYALDTYMVTGKDQVQFDAANIPVNISGVQVCHGDLMLCDDNGVVCIPAGKAERVLEIALEIDRKEAETVEGVEVGGWRHAEGSKSKNRVPYAPDKTGRIKAARTGLYV